MSEEEKVESILYYLAKRIYIMSRFDKEKAKFILEEAFKNKINEPKVLLVMNKIDKYLAEVV